MPMLLMSVINHRHFGQPATPLFHNPLFHNITCDAWAHLDVLDKRPAGIDML